MGEKIPPVCFANRPSRIKSGISSFSKGVKFEWHKLRQGPPPFSKGVDSQKLKEGPSPFSKGVDSHKLREGPPPLKKGVDSQKRVGGIFHFSSPFPTALLSTSCLVLLTGCTINNSQVNLQVFLNNLATTYGALWNLVTAWAYLVGAFFGITALFQLRIYGEQQTMMAGQRNLFRPLAYLFVSVMLMWLPSTFSTLMMSTFGTPSATPLSYSQVSTVGVYGYQLAITPALIGLLKIVGLVSFVRGWMLLVRVADHAQPGTFGKALTHIIGGILLINIVGAGNILWKLVSHG